MSALVGVLGAVAFLGSPASALGQVEIPLDSAISPQYHAAEATAAVEAAVAAVPAEAVPAAPAPAPPPAPAPAPAAPPAPPADDTESAPQYHAPNKSEYEAQEAPAKTPSAPAPPAEAEPPAEEEPRAKGPQPEDVAKHAAIPAAEPASEAEAPAVPEPPGMSALATLPGLSEIAKLADGSTSPNASKPPANPEPLVLPDLPQLPSVPEVTNAPVAPDDGGGGLAGNVNVSIRIFSPGDDGPVTQIVQGGLPPPASAVSAPTTWIWNWHWVGAPGCDPGQGPIAPPLGVAGWTWNWTWSCDGGGGAAAGPGFLPAISVPGVGKLPGLALAPDLETLVDVESLTSLGSLPGFGIPFPTPSISVLAKPAADAPESRAGRERSGDPSYDFTSPGSQARARAPLAGGVAALVAAPAAADPVAARVHKRRGGRDISRARGLIPANPGSPAPSAAVASAAAASGAGGSAAVLTAPIILFLSLLGGALFAGVGLPRLKLRASRLERPG